MIKSIWRDIYLNNATELGDKTTMQYSVNLRNDGTVIYRGKAVIRPGDTYCEVKVNDIISDYLINTLPYIGNDVLTAMSFPLGIELQRYSPSLQTWVTEDSFDIINDWSYDRDFDPNTMVLAHPIGDRVALNAPILYSVLVPSDIIATFYHADGTTEVHIIPIAVSGDFNNDFNNDFSRSLAISGGGTACFIPGNFGDNITKVVINGGECVYNINACGGRYTLCYVNSYGGWDVLNVEGVVKPNYEAERKTIDQSYDNRISSNRGKRNYLNVISKSYTFTTGWLNDIGGERMHNLINSTCVYLWDSEKKEMLPLIINDTVCEEKTYKNNGCHLVNYTISASEATTRIRR